MPSFVKQLPGRLITAVFAITLAGMILRMRAQFSWFPPTWEALSISVREGSVPAGMILAFVSMWVAGSQRYGFIYAGKGHVRSGERLASRHFLQMLMPAWLAITVVFIAGYFETLNRQPVGQLDWLLVASGYLSWGVWIAVGYFCGNIAARPLAAALTAIFVAAMWFPSNVVPDTPLQSVSPAWMIEWPRPGILANADVTVLRIVFHLLLILALLLAGAHFSQLVRTSHGERGDHGLRSRIRRWATAPTLLLIGALLLAGFAVYQRPHLVHSDLNAPITCIDTPGIKLCFHAAYAELANQLEPTVQKLDQVTASTLDISMDDSSIPDELGKASLWTATYSDYVSRDDMIYFYASNLVDAVAWRNCERLKQSQNPLSPAEEQHLEAAQSLTYVLLKRLGFSGLPHGLSSSQSTTIPGSGTELATYLNSLSDTALSQWFSTYSQPFRQCELTGGERLP